MGDTSSQDIGAGSLFGNEEVTLDDGTSWRMQELFDDLEADESIADVIDFCKTGGADG